jgi:hypothetical protein
MRNVAQGEGSMTKDEALRLALEALETLVIERGSIYDQAITAVQRALAQPEPNYKKALEVWLDKTEWVQETVKSHELGMHRADVLKQRIEEALAQPWEKFCDSNCVWTDHHPDCKLAKDEPVSQPKVRTGNCLRVGVCASEGHKIQPQRTWVGLTDIDYAGLPLEQVGLVRWAEAKLKAKNT